MNYCTKCESLYSQPGTCNCYAVPGPGYVPPIDPPTVRPWSGPKEISVDGVTIRCKIDPDIRVEYPILNENIVGIMNKMKIGPS